MIKKYKIKSKFILGHSDIAPKRKKDPGEKFPWKYLSNHKIGLFHNLKQKKLLENRGKKISNLDKNRFITNLNKIGYLKNSKNKDDKYSKILASAFQRRFRQELINGLIDKECLIISENIVKKLNNFS